MIQIPSGLEPFEVDLYKAIFSNCSKLVKQGVSINEAEKAIQNILDIVNECDNVNDCKYLGVTELADSSIQYLLEIDCDQQYKNQVRRDTLKSILKGLSKNNIEVPYTQIDIHNK